MITKTIKIRKGLTIELEIDEQLKHIDIWLGNLGGRSAFDGDGDLYYGGYNRARGVRFYKRDK